MPIRAAKVQASLRIRVVSTEPPLLAHTGSESRGIFKQKASSLAPLNGWACAVKICHDGLLEDTNSLDVAQYFLYICSSDPPESRSRSTDYHTKSTKIRSSDRSGTDDIPRESRYETTTSSVHQRQYPARVDPDRSQNIGSSRSDPGWSRNGRCGSETYGNQNGTDTESSCSASTANTVRETHPYSTSRPNSHSSHQESLPSLDSTVKESNLREGSRQFDTGTDKTIDDVLESHEVKTDNMKNMTRDIGNKMSENMRKGLGREISTDSGIADLLSSTQPGSPVSESSAYSFADRGLVPRSNVQTTAKRDSSSTYQDGKSQKTVKRDDKSIESTDVENASKGIFMAKAEQVCGNIDGVDTLESLQSSSAAMTATGTASKLKTEEKDGKLITKAEFEGDSRLARQESAQSTIETDNTKLTKTEDVKEEIQSKNTESTNTTQGRRGSDSTTVSTSKQENTKKESVNKSTNESKVLADGGVSNVSKTEDSKSLASSFSGKSSMQEKKGGKTYTKSISNQSSSESKTSNVSESKAYSSTSSDTTLTDGDRTARPEHNVGDSFSRTYDLGIDDSDDDGLYERRNSGGSEISRPGSTASSIDSSASAMYAREQQRKREREAESLARNRKLEDHRGSVDSITKAKQVANSKYDRNDSEPLFGQSRLQGSDTGQSTSRQRDRIYQNVPRSESAFSSVSDDVFMDERPLGRNRNLVSQQPKSREQKHDRNSDDFRNRRSTLQGDIILTEREVFKTRDELRPNPRGKDDSFISSHDESYYSSKDRIPELSEKERDKRFMDSDVIEREIISETMSEEDILFGDVDDFFGSSDEFFGKFKSKSSKIGNRRNMDDFFENGSLFSRRPKIRGANPYKTRDDLSKISSSEVLNDPKLYSRRKTYSDAMSDSALRTNDDSSRDRLKPRAPRYGYSETEFDDSASVRSLPPQIDKRSGSAFENISQRLNTASDSSQNYVQDYINRNAPVPSYDQTMNRLRSNSSNPSLGVVQDTRSGYDFKSDSGLYSSGNASDSLFSAGKSIDRNSRSMKQNNRNYNSTVKSFSDKNLISDKSNKSRRHLGDRCYDEIDMHDGANTRASTNLSEGYVSGDTRSRDRGYQSPAEGQGTPESRRQDKKLSADENADWESRRQRIDKALSWIRTELVSRKVHLVVIIRLTLKTLSLLIRFCQNLTFTLFLNIFLANFGLGRERFSENIFGHLPATPIKMK